MDGPGNAQTLQLTDFMILINQMGISPPIPKPDIARMFQVVATERSLLAAKTNEAVPTALTYTGFIECLFRAARHPSLDSQGLGSDPRVRLGSVLRTISKSVAVKQLEHKFSVKMDFELRASTARVCIIFLAIVP